MKIIRLLIAALVGTSLVQSAHAVEYLGTWNNTTFGSSGPLLIEFDQSKTRVAVSFDLDGPVFGSIDPPAIRFNAPLDAKGGGKFNVKGTALGDLTGTFTAQGNLAVAIRNIPGGQLTEFRFSGKFDLSKETFKGSYEIDNASGLFAEGLANAVVPKPPTITVPKTVKVTGKSASTIAQIASNSKLTAVTATTKDGATVVITKKKPYRITVSNITKASTKVTIKATNASGKSSKKVVTFIQAS